MADDGPFGPVVNGTQIVFYQYRPNKGGAYTFIVLFGLATLGHLVYLFRLRAWYFIPFILGGIGEAFGYYGRAWSSDEPDLAGPFILQNILILGSAPLLAASVYMSFGRIIVSLGAQKYALISPRWVTKLYVLIDIGAWVSQVFGSVIPASGDPSSIDLGRKVVLGGLITQLAALGFFLLGVWYIWHRVKRVSLMVLASDPGLNWENHFRAVGVITLAMMVRSVVRMVEYLQGSDGTIVTHEIFLYALDAAIMFLIMLVYIVIHPGRLIRDARRITKDTYLLSEGPVMLPSR
ncbi:RTA1-domain-containing protein [Thozetella sp. PMI_491]|nr:RTA1-domain-containing protein [Thozetella sp. PMI_491]